MANYQSDRIFTDYVFKKLAKTLIYPQLEWVEENIDSTQLEQLDIHNGIDTIVRDAQDNIFGVQYRFRDNRYADRYNDVTLRYKRDNNFNKDRVMSEFFKIEANYFLYGVTNGKKCSNALETNTTFVKWALIDIQALKSAIDNGLIIIDSSTHHRCRLSNGRMLCPINQNTDGSSSFVPFDIPIMKQISNNIVVCSFGF